MIKGLKMGAFWRIDGCKNRIIDDEGIFCGEK